MGVEICCRANSESGKLWWKKKHTLDRGVSLELMQSTRRMNHDSINHVAQVARMDETLRDGRFTGVSTARLFRPLLQLAGRTWKHVWRLVFGNCNLGIVGVSLGIENLVRFSLAIDF